METAQEYGYLVVKTVTARGAIPLEGVQVLISDHDDANRVLYSLRSGPDGQTPKIRLPAPPRSYSESPGNENKPYREYNVRADYRGYYPAEYVGIPVYSGITSIQQINLEPYLEGDINRRQDTRMGGTGQSQSGGEMPNL